MTSGQTAGMGVPQIRLRKGKNKHHQKIHLIMRFDIQNLYRYVLVQSKVETTVTRVTVVSILIFISLYTVHVFVSSTSTTV